jgi:hypothetical protein
VLGALDWVGCQHHVADGDTEVDWEGRTSTGVAGVNLAGGRATDQRRGPIHVAARSLNGLDLGVGTVVRCGLVS